MLTTVLVTPDAPRFAPGRFVAHPPIPCRACGGKMVVPIERNGPDDIVGEIHCDCTDGTEPLTSCLIATPGTECETCGGRGEVRDDMFGASPCDCTNGQRPGVVLGTSTFGAGLPIVHIDAEVYGGEWFKVEPEKFGEPPAWMWLEGAWLQMNPADCLGDWVVGNVAYPIESYTLVTDPGGCPARDMIEGIPGWMARGLKRCDVCNGEGHLPAPWSPPWLPTEPGVHFISA